MGVLFAIFFKNISKSVAKYTTNERYRTVPSSIKIFLIRSYPGVSFTSRKPVVFGKKL